jgi:membrane protease subunit HflK
MEPRNDVERLIADVKKNLRFILPAGLILLALAFGRTAFYTVDPDEEAVVIRLGKYVGTSGPGLHFKLPLGVDRVIHVKTKRVLQAEFGFRTATSRTRRTTYSNNSYDDESLMLTGDLNVADVEWVVQYQIADPFKFIFRTSEPEQNIRDISESIMRRVIGDRLVTEVLTTGRVEIATNAKILMQEVLSRYDMGVRILTVKLQDVNPPEVVKKSFNEVNEAKQEQEKVILQAKKKKNKVIPEAKGKALKLVSEAKAYKTSLVNRALGDTQKFEKVLKEYRLAPEITKKKIYLETMEKVLDNLNGITLFDPKVKGVLPIFNQLKAKGVIGEK